MPRHVSFRADVRRRVMEVLIAIAPDAPFPTRLIADIISLDSMIGGPYDRVLDNLGVARPAAIAGIFGVGLPDEIAQDEGRGTIAITSAGQTLLREQLKGMPPTPQTRARQKNGLDNVGSDLLVQLYQYAAYLPGATGSDALSPDHLALIVPHFLSLSRAELEQPNGDWGPPQNLATLWMLNDHGVVPEQILAAHTHELLAVCERYYRNWDWEAVSMLLQATEEMINASWSEAETVGGRLLDMAEEIIPTEEPKLQPRHRKDTRELRKKLHPRQAT